MLRCTTILAAAAAWAAALSGCGSETVAKNNRAIAEWALKLGGGVRLEGSEREIKDPARLPQGRFYVSRINLNNTKTTDKDLQPLAELSGLGELVYLGLYGTRITDRGLDRVAELTSLEELELSNTSITDRGLAKLASLENLRKLYVSDTRVTDKGLAELRSAIPDCRIVRVQ